MSWNRPPSHIRRLTIQTTLMVAFFLALVFGATFLYSRSAALEEKESELRYASQAFIEDAPKYPDLPELQENHPELSATVFTPAQLPSSYVGASILPWCNGFQVDGNFVLYGLNVSDRQIVVGAPWASDANGLKRLAAVLVGTWFLLVGIVALVTVRSAKAVFMPLKSLASEANSIGGADLSKRLQVDDDAEFAEMTSHLNGMLDRLERSAEREKQFSSDVAHELRTPLAILRTQIETTLLRPRKPEAYADALKGMLSEVDRLSSISTSLLATARTFDAEPPAIDLEPVVKETANRWMPRFTEMGQTLETSSSSVLIKILPAELEIALNNLLENALTFSKAGAKTTIELSQTPTWARVVVSDQGPGIPPELSETLFDRFVRGESSRNRQTGGMGIGLALVKKIVEGRGGRIWQEALSPGTRFYLEWPL